MLIRRPSDVAPSEITPRALFEQRRDIIRLLGAGSIAALGGAALLRPRAALATEKFAALQKSAYSTMEKPTPYKDVATYNNFYEFGTDKSSPSERAGRMKTRPWSVTVEGLVKRPHTYAIEDLLKFAPLEERVYRMRCVEGWSMVIPWVGFPLQKLVQAAEPLGDAKYVEFQSLHDARSMPGTLLPVLDWPYIEGLRLDEAMHPLALLAVGLYGETLPNQNGAPLRLVVPWKYGFKGAKSIVRIRFTDKQPQTAWMKAAPNEYGFYSNVNPEVDHPRWSQATERRIGEFLKRRTLMFNGYGDQVAHLYTGMDLRKYF